MDKNQNQTNSKIELKEENEMAVSDKELTKIQQQVIDAERKAIIRNAARKAFEKYDDVFKKLSKNRTIFILSLMISENFI